MTASDSRVETPSVKKTGNDLDSDREIDEPRVEPKFFTRGTRGRPKPANPFSGLQKRKVNDKMQKGKSMGGMVFPFHQ